MGFVSVLPIETMAAAGIFYHVQQLEQLVRRKVDECLKPEGLTAGQFLALSLIVHQGPFSAAELARRTNVTAQSVGEYTKALQVKGLIDREVDSNNPRIFQLHATPAGQATLSRCAAAVDAAEQAVLDCLSKEEVAHLRYQITRIRHAAEAKAA